MRTTHDPASRGGPPIIDRPQEEALRWPIITKEDERAVLAVLRSGRLSIHEEVAELEEDYRGRLGLRHAVAHCNGTSAIHAVMHAFGIGPGDEVIVPSATWWASVMPILHCGGVPVFAESEDRCLGLDPTDVQAKLTDRTRAIVIVHLFGMPSRIAELLAIARRHGLKVLEDASHAHGASYHGQPVGTFGDASVFSMQANKLVPSGEGGILLTDDDELLDRVIRFGHSERLIAAERSPNRRYAATGFGFKFRMSPLSAAVARVQLRHLDERNRRRNDNCIYLSERLEKLGLETFQAPEDTVRTYFEFPIACEPARVARPLPELARALQSEGARVEAPRYPLLHQQPIFTEGTWAKLARIEPAADRPLRTYDPADLPRTRAGNARLMRLPTFPSADRGLLDQYARAFEKVLTSAGAASGGTE